MKFFNGHTPYSRGFTLVELLVSISIFVFMTGLVLTRYRSFDQNVFLTNLAHDVVLTVRTAQNYGLNVKGAENSFNVGYGVHLDSTSGNNKSTTIFAFPRSNEAVYAQAITSSKITQAMGRGAFVSALCAGASSSNCPTRNSLDISFKRPDLDAIICANGSCATPHTYARITLSSSGGSIRHVIVQSSGQISIED